MLRAELFQIFILPLLCYNTLMTKLPYGKQNIEINIPEANIIESRLNELKSEKDGFEIVAEAMKNSIASPALSELAAGKKTCTVIISDHTRPVPSKDILPLMLKELRTGNPDIEITLLVATGCHRLTTPEEIREKVGDEIADNEKIVVHDCDYNNEDIGILPFVRASRLLSSLIRISVSLIEMSFSLTR